MKILVFAALAAVFMLSSGFSSAENIEKSALAYQCDCLCEMYVPYEVMGQIIWIDASFYTAGEQRCSDFSSGFGVYNDEDCQNTPGMLNAQSSESFVEAQSGNGC